MNKKLVAKELVKIARLLNATIIKDDFGKPINIDQHYAVSIEYLNGKKYHIRSLKPFQLGLIDFPIEGSDIQKYYDEIPQELIGNGDVSIVPLDTD